VTRLSFPNVLVLSTALLLSPYSASAQEDRDPIPRSAPASGVVGRDQQTNVPPAARQAEDAVERAVKRFRIGVEGGVGLDPELIMVGAHGAFAPIFSRNVEFRPGIELGVGEVTTLFGINLDVIYTLPGAARGTRWTPYVGAGPNLSVSHQGVELEDDDRNRFDFSDTDFDAGFNIIAGARSPNGVFVELKATAYGVTNIRLLAGFNF
jgi:hypothetical protein